MQRTLVLNKEFLGLIEELRKPLAQILQINDHLLKAPTQLLQESRDQEITVQDLMINPRIII